MSCNHVENMKASATESGIDGGTITEILSKFGPDVLAIVTEAAKSNFSVSWIIDTLNKFGPTVLQFLTDLMHKNAAIATPLGVAGQTIIIDKSHIQTLDTNLIQQTLQQILPVILQQYGPQVVQWIITMITNAMSGSSGSTITANNAVKFDATFIQTILGQLLPMLLQKYGTQIIQAIIDMIMKAIVPTPASVVTPVTPVDPVQTGVIL